MLTMKRGEYWTTVFARVNRDDNFKEVKQLILFFLKLNFLQKVRAAHLFMKGVGYASYFCSASRKAFQSVTAQIYFELYSFEMVEHILLGWKLGISFFPSFWTQELLTLCMFLQRYQVMCISNEAILGPRSSGKQQLKRHS